MKLEKLKDKIKNSISHKKEDDLIPASQFKYEAFISYRHNKVQSRLTSVLQKELEHFTIPKELRQNNQRHFLPIFRDKEELGVSSNLDEKLKKALDQSHFLILFCSLETFQSRWVLEEVKYFLKSHPVEDVLPVVVSGEPSEVFPKEITQKEDPDCPGKFLTIEPLALDVRGESLNQQIRLIKKEKFRIISRMLNVSYDSLAKRQREYNLKRGIALSLIISILGISFGMYATIQNNHIESLFLETRKSLIEGKALEAWNLISQGEEGKALDLFSQFNNSFDQSLSSALYYPLSEITEIYSPILDLDPALRLKRIDQVHFLWENKTQVEASFLNGSIDSSDLNQDYLLFIDDEGKLYIYSIQEKGLVGLWTTSDFEEMSGSTNEENQSSFISPIHQAMFVEQNKIIAHYDKKIILFNFETEKIEKSLDISDESFSSEILSWSKDTLAVYRSSGNLSIYDQSLNLIQEINEVEKRCLDLEKSKDQYHSLEAKKLLWNTAGDQLLLYGSLSEDSMDWYPSDPNAPYSPHSTKFGLYLIDLKQETVKKLGEDQKIYSIFEMENDWIVLQKVKEEPVVYANYQEYLDNLSFYSVGETPCHIIRFHEGKEVALSPTYNIYHLEEENFSLVSFGEDKIPTLRVNEKVIFLDPHTLVPTHTLRFHQPVEWIEGLNKDQFLIQTIDGNLKVGNKIESSLFDTEFKICSSLELFPLKVLPIYSSDLSLERLVFLTHDSLGYSIIQYKLKERDEDYIPTQDEKVIRSSSTQDFLLTLSSLYEGTSLQRENYILKIYDLNRSQEVFNQSIKIGSEKEEWTNNEQTIFLPATQIFVREGENHLIFVNEHEIEFQNLEKKTDPIITSYSLLSPRFSCISKDGKQIFISGEEKNLVFFDEDQDGKFEREIPIELDFKINGGEWTADGNYLVLAGETQLSFWSKTSEDLIEIDLDGVLTQSIENVNTINDTMKAPFTSPSNLPFGGFRVGKEKNRVLYCRNGRSGYFSSSVSVIDLDKKAQIQTVDLNEFDKSIYNLLGVNEIDFTNHDETLLIKNIASDKNESDEAPHFNWIDLSTGISKNLTIPNEGNNEPFLYGHVLLADNLGQEFILKDASSFHYGWSQSNGILKAATSFFKIDQEEELAFLQWVSKYGEEVEVDFKNKKIGIFWQDQVFILPMYSYEELLNKTINAIQESS